MFVWLNTGKSQSGNRLLLVVGGRVDGWSHRVCCMKVRVFDSTTRMRAARRETRNQRRHYKQDPLVSHKKEEETHRATFVVPSPSDTETEIETRPSTDPLIFLAFGMKYSVLMSVDNNIFFEKYTNVLLKLSFDQLQKD